MPGVISASVPGRRLADVHVQRDAGTGAVDEFEQRTPVWETVWRGPGRLMDQRGSAAEGLAAETVAVANETVFIRWRPQMPDIVVGLRVTLSGDSVEGGTPRRIVDVRDPFRPGPRLLALDLERMAPS